MALFLPRQRAIYQCSNYTLYGTHRYHSIDYIFHTSVSRCRLQTSDEDIILLSNKSS